MTRRHTPSAGSWMTARFLSVSPGWRCWLVQLFGEFLIEALRVALIEAAATRVHGQDLPRQIDRIVPRRIAILLPESLPPR